MSPLGDGQGRASVLALGAMALVAMAPSTASAQYETVVRAPGGPHQPVSTAVDATEGRTLPGTGGDPTLAAQDLPGVARPSPGATGLVIWGAAPAESRVLFEGIEIPALYHFGGFRSTVGAERVGRIDVVPGAFSAEYGRSTGGIVRIDSRPLSADRTRLALDVNLLDAALSAEAAPSPGFRVGAAIRASYLSETYGRLAPAEATSLYPIPRYADAQVEASADVGRRATLRALVLASLERVERRLDPLVLGLPPRTEDRKLRWWRGGIVYSERGTDDGLTATVYAGADRSARHQSFGPAPSFEDVTSATLGLRARYRATLAPDLRLTLGFDGTVDLARVTRRGSLTMPAREGDLTVFGEPPGDDVNADTWRATVGDAGVFALASYTHGAWNVSPGLRADAFAMDGDRLLPPVGATPRIGYSHVAWALDPRLSIGFAPTQGLILKIALGLYHQPPEPRDLSAVFGSPNLGPSRAVHGTLSLRKEIAARTSVEVIGFCRRLDDLPVRSPLPTPTLAEALISYGRGRVLGASALVRRELAEGTSGWLTYTLSRSERWTGDGPARLFDLDQTHVLSAVGSHRRGQWTLGARARYATGMPRTPITGTFFDTRDGIHQPLFGLQNSVRLPAFLQLDVRVDRSFTAGPLSVTLYLDIQNISGRRNPEEIVYSEDLSSSGYLTGPPFLALFGARIES